MARNFEEAQNELMAALSREDEEGEPEEEVSAEEPTEEPTEEPIEEPTELPVEEPAVEEPAPQEDKSISILEQIRDGLIAQQQQEPQAPPQAEPPADNFDYQGFMDRLMEDPKGTLSEFAAMIEQNATLKAKQEMLQEVSPALEFANTEMTKQQVAGVLDGFFRENEDALPYADSIIKYVQENNLPPDQRSLKEAYLSVKNGELSQRKSFDEYLTDDASIDKMLSDDGFMSKLLSNPAFSERLEGDDGLKGKVISKYLSELEGDKKPATLSDASGSPPATPPTGKPKTLSGAGDALFRDLAGKK